MYDPLGLRALEPTLELGLTVLWQYCLNSPTGNFRYGCIRVFGRDLFELGISTPEELVVYHLLILIVVILKVYWLKVLTKLHLQRLIN